MTAARLRAGAVAALLAALPGCLPTLTAESLPPPGRTARLDAITGFWGVRGYRLELSQGVAIAVSCTASGPCEQLTASSDDPAIAEARPAALNVLRPTGYSFNQQPAAAIVVVGKQPGRTTVRLHSAAGDRKIQITVAAPAVSAR